MRSNRRSWTSPVATLLFLLFVSTWIVAAWSGLQDPVDPLDTSDFVWAFSFTAFPLVGWLLAVKHPQNPLGWIFLTFPTAIAVGILGQDFAPEIARAGYSAIAFTLFELGGWLFAFGFWLLLVPGILLFPDGRLLNNRFRWALLGSALLLVVMGLTVLIGTETSCIEESLPEGGVCTLSVDNPLRLSATVNLSTLTRTLLFLLLPVMGVITIAGVVVRYRQSTGDVRQQIKWVAWLASAGILLFIGVTVIEDLFGITLNDWVGTLTFMVITVGLPVAIGVAIFKYRLYDIDRVISRTAAYALVVGILAGVFVVSVTLAQQLLPVESQFGVVVSTLVVAALFNPLRRRVQSVVDRRFNRSRYDAQRVLDEFSIRLRDSVDLDLMQLALLSAAQENLQPSHLSLWVRERK